MESDKVLRILATKQRMIESTIGPFVYAGRTLLTLTELEESVEFNINFRGDSINVKILKESGQNFFFDDEFCNKNNDVKQMIFNLIINQAFRETNLKQIGRRPQFFDVQNPIDLSRQNLMVMPGFKASAF